jgi:hypothetical protein
MQKICFLLPICSAVTGLFFSASAQGVGHKDTPQLPGQKWLVHDSDRPVPRIVTPAETFSHSAKPPSDAVVLFDGKDLSQWRTGKGGEAKWKVVTEECMGCCKTNPPKKPEAGRGAEMLIRPVTSAKTTRCACPSSGYMEIVKDSGSIFTKEEFGDFQLHLEFATPEKVDGTSQGRGNSGVLIYGKYEVQVLDSYNNPTYPDGQLGALYGQFPPLVNPAKKPGEWQSYDIIFEGPRWDENDKLTRPASVTVLLNGVVIHNKKEYIGESGHKVVGKYKPHPPQGPIMLQEHNNPTRFRNIWIRKLGEYDKP